MLSVCAVSLCAVCHVLTYLLLPPFFLSFFLSFFLVCHCKDSVYRKLCEGAMLCVRCDLYAVVNCAKGGGAVCYVGYNTCVPLIGYL